MTPVLAFDIETIPDVAGLRRSMRWTQPSTMRQWRSWRFNAARPRVPISCNTICIAWWRCPARCARTRFARVDARQSPEDDEATLVQPSLMASKVHAADGVLEMAADLTYPSCTTARWCMDFPRRVTGTWARMIATSKWNNYLFALPRGIWI